MKQPSVWKRPGRDAYYTEFTFRGKRYQFCLETANKELAEAAARSKYKTTTEAVIRGDYKTIDALKLRQPVATTVDELLAVYATIPAKVSATTRKQNALALRQFLRECAGADGSAPITAINDQLARAWFTAATGRALLLDKKPKEQITLYTSANSRFQQAASVFSRRALDTYKSKDMFNPCFLKFLETGKALRFPIDKRLKNRYDAPNQGLMDTILAAWQELADKDRDLFLTIGFELAFGLRAGETQQVTWGWLKDGPGYPVLDGNGSFKSGDWTIRVRALDPWYSILLNRINAKGWRGKDDEPILQGCLTYRTDNAFRNVSKWMRDLKWTAKKTNHAFRAYAASQIAMKYGIYEASAWCRHSSVKVTEQNYGQYVKTFKPANLDEIPARWATLDQAPQLSVVTAA